MKKIRAKIAKMLTMIMLFQGVLGGNEKIFAEILNDVQNESIEESFYNEATEGKEEEIEDTGERIEESGEGEALEDEEEIFNEVVVSGGSIDIEKYEIDENQLTDEAKQLLDVSKYSSLDHYRKFILNKELQVREDTMKICEERGLDVRSSIVKALIMQRMGFNYDETEETIQNYKSEKIAEQETYKYSLYTYDYAFMNDEVVSVKLKDYVKKGVETDNIINGYAVSEALGIEMDEAIADYTDGSKKYKENEEKISAKKEELGITDGIALLADDEDEYWTTTDTYEPNLTGMFNVKGSIDEGINYSKGTIVYTDTALNLTGINGLDIDIKLMYESGESDAKTDFGCFNLNMTRLTAGDGSVISTSKEDLRRVRFSDGSIYPVQRRSGNGFKIMNYGENRPELSEDVNSSFPGAKYVIEYIDKHKSEYFNSRGELIGIRDNFGNTITIDKDSYGTMTYTDTIGRKVIVAKNSNSMTRTKPDGKTITYTINGSEIKKTDEAGYVTTYTYEKEAKSENEYTLTKVTYPTGMQSIYRYEKVPNTDSKRIVEKYYLIDGSVKNKSTFTYSDMTYKGYDEKTGTKKSSYTYSMTEMDSNGVKTVYTYDDRHLNTKKEKYC